MSSLIVEVCKIEDVKSHPNADRLELATVKGWELAVHKGQFQVGDKVVYFPIDSMLPLDLAERYNVRQHLDIKGDRGRIRCAKIRQIPSFGLAQTPDLDWEVGTDVSEYYNVTKYEPPVRDQGDDYLAPHPLFFTYTDIENMRNFPEVIKDGEQVVVTEKIHGMNVRIGMIEGEIMAGSHNVRRKQPVGSKRSPYWYPYELTGVQNFLHDMNEWGRKQTIIFGEVYGQGIQSLNYGLTNSVGFRAFDILVEGKYLDYDSFVWVTETYGIERVPTLGVIPFSLEKIKELSSGNSTIGGDHVREGVVVKPTVERFDPEIGRVILKYINDDYLFSKVSDYKDE